MDIHALTEQLALNPMDPKDLLSTFGLPGVLAILFAETGLLVGFFFPGDSLLFLAGVAASSVADSIFGSGAKLPIAGLLIGAPICAIIGAQLGHWLGARYGRRMFDKPDSKLFKKEYVEKAEYYFEKFGPAKAVVLARFIPVVRTFLNPVAGTLGMPARQFFVWNVVGAILWTDGIILIGYLLAQQIYDAIGDKIDHYILPVVVLIVLISVLPILIEILRERKHKKNAPADGPGPAEAFGVVAVATVAGAADAAHEEIHPHHQQQPYGGQTYGQPQTYGESPAYGQPQTHGQPSHGQATHGQPQSYGHSQSYGQPQYGEQDRYDEPTGQYGGQQYPPPSSGAVYGTPASGEDPYGQQNQNWPR
ncbi:putative membrane protein [Actinoplanes missouriensis 431]|uniref:Putative membrane protein n=1 Tax=Actinoplanes missouriensis (strain ATCC 14538 / DSM 43046 / CBS 188.64 / JCM 3121 / NBRC 102363 / NCIMB 12654 / NRRL B-3342 / UNCC 431) TaxID=512565 RepID=I0GX31_ACTM4|nr:putative membrane protein [Actinoplanes missouriensis 431]